METKSSGWIFSPRRGDKILRKFVPLTPAEAQETFADEPRPHFANDGQVGLPRLRQHPAEGCQKEEMQEGSGHSAEALRGEQKERGDDDKNRRKSGGFERAATMNCLPGQVSRGKQKTVLSFYYSFYEFRQALTFCSFWLITKSKHSGQSCLDYKKFKIAFYFHRPWFADV